MKVKTFVHKKTYTQLLWPFIHNCQSLEATKCPSIGECVNSVTLTMDYYSALQRNQLSNQECLLLGEEANLKRLHAV